MASPSSTVQRAFQLAAGGECLSMDDLRRKLKAERYEGVEAHLSGASLAKQLRALIKSSRSSAIARPELTIES